ncbi:MAG: hypothetical protein M8357_03460 [Desulfobulbaceae bacterium]|nr:hypothetical protein [Desulfobulbaceae bacterium]
MIFEKGKTPERCEMMPSQGLNRSGCRRKYCAGPRLISALSAGTQNLFGLNGTFFHIPGEIPGYSRVRKGIPAQNSIRQPRASTTGFIDHIYSAAPQKKLSFPFKIYIWHLHCKLLLQRQRGQELLVRIPLVEK